MRKALAAILAIAFTLSLCACGGTNAVPTDDQAPASSQVDIITTASNEATTNYETTTTTCVTTDATTQDTTPVHTHSYSSATCTAPATCSCGATQGSANGHSWKDASCLAPKTCAVCNATSGLAVGHNFSDGTCAACGKADPDSEQVTNVWIPTNGGQKYHKTASCSNMKNPEQVTQSEAESRGFTPCKRCYQ